MLKVVCDKILVKPIAVNTVSDWGITLETRTEKPEQGEVVATGNEVKTVKIGHIVFFTKYTPDIIEDEGVEYYSIKESLILAYKETA